MTPHNIMLTKHYEPCEHGVTGHCSLCEGPCPCCGAGPRDLYCARPPDRTVMGHEDTCLECWATVRDEGNNTTHHVGNETERRDGPDTGLRPMPF